MTQKWGLGMHLYLLRHGIAFERSEWNGPDATRPLTGEGEERTGAVLKELKQQNKLQVEAIWSSPLVRALQTAHIAGKALNLPVKVVDELTSGTSLAHVQARFGKTERLPERLMIVGHEPDLGFMIGELTGDPAGDYALKKAGIALLDGVVKPGGMKLVWKFTPKDVLAGA